MEQLLSGGCSFFFLCVSHCLLELLSNWIEIFMSHRKIKIIVCWQITKINKDMSQSYLFSMERGDLEIGAEIFVEDWSGGWEVVGVVADG